MEQKTERTVDRLIKLAHWLIDKGGVKNVTVFEKACGLSGRYLRNLSQTKVGNPSCDTIAQVYRTFPGISLHWLVLGEGEMLAASEDEVLSAAKQQNRNVNKQEKIKRLLNHELKDMTREERLELISKLM